MEQEKPKRVVIYTRISSDPTDEEKGVTRQEEDCRAFVKLRRLELVGPKQVYKDNNTSAWSGARRDEWQEVLKLAEAGQIDGIVTWHMDRIVRRMSDLVKLLAIVEKHGLSIYSATGGRFDLASPEGVMVAQILTAVAEHESSHKGVRVARAKRQNAEDGLPGSGPRPFGFQEDKIRHDEGEAAALKAAVEAFIADPRHRLSEAVAVIERHGYDMTARRLRTLLVSGRIAGRRDYVSMEMRRNRRDGKALGYFLDVGPDSPPAKWDEIISYDQWLLCRSILLDPRRTRSMPRRANSLLAGLIVCGQCGGYMTHGGSRYQCNPGHKTVDNANGCGGVSARSELINSSVLALCKATILEMDDVKIQTMVTPDAMRRHELLGQRANLVGAQQGLLETFAETAIARSDPHVFHAQVRELERLIEEVNDELAELTEVELTTAGLELKAELLDEGDEATRRRIIDALIQEVIIYPVGKGKDRAKHPFPESWDIWWKGGSRPVRRGMAKTSVRMATAARRTQ